MMLPLKPAFAAFAAITALSASLIMPDSLVAATFGDDLAFMRQHVEVLLLSDTRGKSQIAVVPSYQGRVMTSTASGPSGTSFGWINRNLIASRKPQRHINAFGGEERFWMGPEGGQFSIFFKKGDPFDLAHWQTPPVVDTDRYEIKKQTPQSVQFQHSAQFENYSGFRFQVEIDRKITLLPRGKVSSLLGVADLSTLEFVGYESRNTLKNAGPAAWTKQTGLLSIWILGMLNPGPQTTVVLPYRRGPDSKLGPVVNDSYFGKIPSDRLQIARDVIFFKGDGQQRGKIGLSPARAKPLVGSYDPSERILTLVQFSIPKLAVDYVNSMWEVQKEPFKGDVVNSYNDGPPTPGAKPLGPFYELETSSKAAALPPGDSLTHISRTFHFKGSEADLNRVSRRTLGVSIEDIRRAFNRP